MKKVSSIMVGKIIKLRVWIAGIVLVCSCGNANVSSRTDDDGKELYMQIAFEDFFDNDVLDLYIDNKLVVQHDTLKSGFSDGVTNTVLSILKSKDRYIIDVHKQSIEYVPKNDTVFVSVVLNGNKNDYQIDQHKGKYVGFSKNKDGSLEFGQSEERPMYD
ncbi:hypothetical protein FKG96_06235 [Olivibacter sp. LS-1]|uniref:hypothetical protein n=1 Tax=unclassified Olivibacter TaxID=2632301 RepID=UPI0011EAE632|nr:MULTISPECIES: hypothetical protein [unclassified Olivibacter]MDM8176588.1 hypothetical protein [Olivibacter sp. 47]QEL00424.1 hypothetical protein FKG96_06235 [Olivibacter sp. LS-1]